MNTKKWKAKNGPFSRIIWNNRGRRHKGRLDFMKYYLKHQEVVYRAPKMPIILGKLRISVDIGAV